MAYACKHIGNGDRVPWETLEAAPLKDTVDGSAPRLRTTVRACWSDGALHVRFEYEDDHVVATMTRRDDPLYEEDVVELFLDEEGAGRTYLEFEVSPTNVVFDAVITLGADRRPIGDTAWDAEGLTTAVGENADGTRFAELHLPFVNFRRPPEDGTVWRWNAYRIDDDREGVRHYSAWRPTGAVNFHVPERFGELRFER